MKAKMGVNARVFNIAEQYNLEMTKVHSIITSYIDYCKRLAMNGYKVDILHLVSLVPDVIKNKYAVTLAYECKVIADMIALPQHTVYVIIKEYINSLRDDVLSGRPIEVRGLFSMYPTCDENGKVILIHSAISSQVKEHLKRCNTDVSSIRVHTHKLLKYSIKSDDL